MPRSSLISHADHHHHHHHRQTQSDPTSPHPESMHTHSNHIHEPLIAAGQHALSSYAEYTVLLEEQIRKLTHDLHLAFSHIETLEEELVEARQYAHIFKNENAILRGEIQRLSDGGSGDERGHGHELGHGYQEGLNMMQALKHRLRNLHESVQDLEESLQVLMEETDIVERDEPESEPTGHYFEGGWEDTARLWRDIPAPIGCALEPQPGNGPDDTDPAETAYRFERSNGPSPEERRPQEIPPSYVLRQIDTEMVILQLQDRLEQTETEIEHLTNRCDTQETIGELLADMLSNCQQHLATLPRSIHKFQDEEDGEEEELYCTCGRRMEEEDDEEDEDDEPYCTCREGSEELGIVNEHATLRGGMCGRDEDRESVYDYGGYTNWDQADEPAQGKAATANGKNEIIRELRRQIKRLEEQVRTLTEAAHQEALSRSTDPQCLHRNRIDNGDEAQAAKDSKKTLYRTVTASSFDDNEGTWRDVNLRGGSGDEGSKVEGSHEHADTRAYTSFPASPHLLCRRATSRVGDSNINYFIVYLPPGFIISDSTKPELITHSATTIYYFPTRAAEEVVQQEAWKEKSCGDGHWRGVDLHKIQSKQVFKNAIANMWVVMGRTWDLLTHGDWAFDEKEDEGDMYMVNDNNLFLTNRTREIACPHIRGGSGDEPIHIPSPIDEDKDEDSVDEFKRIYESLMDEARIALTMDSPEQCVHAWMAVATAAQTRNCFFECELETFQEMNDSLMQDLQWHLDVQVELEERLEAAEADKRAMAEEYQDLRTLFAHLVVNSDIHAACTYRPKGPQSYGDRTVSPDLRIMRGGDEEEEEEEKEEKEEGALQPITPKKRKAAAAAVRSGPSHLCTATTTNSFVFYPQRSTIVFAGTSPHIYLFPNKSTLPEIHDMVKNGSEREDLRDDPYVARILEIMKVREDMGIHLPETVSDECITIEMPKIPTGSHLDCETKISSWQVSDADTEGLEMLVKKLEIDSSADNSYRNTSTNTASSEGEKDHYQDVGDLINSLDDPVDADNETRPPRPCVCQACSVYRSEIYSKILNPQSPPVVSVRGGGGDSDYWNNNLCGNRDFLLHHSQQTPPANAPPNTPASYGTIAPASYRMPGDEEITTSRGPLSMRLGRLMFPPKFIQQRENSIRRFDWQHIKRLSPQFKDKSSRGFRYTRSAHCEDWATYLDQHREHCDYCQAAFAKENYATSGKSPRDERDVPGLKNGAGRTWSKGALTENTDNLLLSTAENPDPRLRGGAGNEIDLEYDSEDWRSEWDELASQTQCSGRQPRTFCNSSTLSTKTTVSPPSPVDRGSKPRRWPQEPDLCTAIEFIREGSTISGQGFLQMDVPQVRAGRSRTGQPLLLGTRRPQDGSILEIPYSRCESLYCGSSLGVFVVESDNEIDSKAENWLENPRTAPLPPSQHHSVSSSRYTQQSHDIGLTEVFGSASSMRFDAKSRQSSFRSHRHEFFPASGHSDLSENTLRIRNRTVSIGMPLSEMLNDEMYEEHVRSKPSREPRQSSPKPRLGAKLCKQCTELLALLVEYINKLRQRLRAKRPKKSVSRSAPETPVAPAPSRIGRHPLPFDKSLPPTPHASISTFSLHLEPKEKCPAAVHLEPREKFRAASWASVSVIECAHIIAQAQDRAHADFISQGGGEWHVPTVAGPSDLVKEALMWLKYEAKSSKSGKAVFEGGVGDDTA